MPRGRSTTAHRKVLDAALALVAERGIAATSMDAIAQQSGVSKATIYKHWADKDALLLEMMADLNGLTDRPSFDSGDTRADLTAVLAYRPQTNAELRERIMPHFVTYSAMNVPFGQAWRKRVMEPPQQELHRILQRGMVSGELPAQLDVPSSLAVLLGPMLYWFIFLRPVSESPLGLAQVVVETFWRAHALHQRSERPLLRAAGRKPAAEVRPGV